MTSTRARLTVSFSLVLLGTMIAFSVALWIGRRNAANDEVGVQAVRAADNVLAVIRERQLEGKRMTTVDSQIVSEPVIRPTPELVEALDPLPGYFMVLDSRDRLLYSSTLMRLLDLDDQTAMLKQAVTPPETAVWSVAVRDDSLRLLLLSRGDSAIGPYIRRVAAALPLSVADLSGQLLAGTIVAIAPIIFLVSLAVAYFLANSAFRPVDQLINEVEAITDGRSLHRRLAVGASDDELSRLGLTVNAMLSRLEDSFGALRRFTADASHELKTPLTVLRADVERAMHPATHRGDRMVALEEALQETTRMADLVDSLLTLARADEGRFDLHRTRVELVPLVREVYETAVILGEHAGLTLGLHEIEHAEVLGDRSRIRQLLLNLVTNAIKYTPRNGRVEVSMSRRSPNEVAIAVRDTGIGIAAGDLPHVFERFWRADRARSRASERGGFGLGLAISQWIAQAHGGTLTVQSRLGRGSIFTVTLPLETTAVASAQDSPRDNFGVDAIHEGGASVDFTKT
jgi:signal transduction histidine kinase